MIEDNAVEQRIKAALSADIPNLYVNGFSNHGMLGDVMMVLETNGRPVGVLNMSYTVAKTLALKLGTMVDAFQKQTGRTLLTFEEVAQTLGQENAAQADEANADDMPPPDRGKSRKNGHTRPDA